MATQTRLHLPTFHLDARSRQAGRRGVAKARAALADARTRTAEVPHPDPGRDTDRDTDAAVHGHHATAA